MQGSLKGPLHPISDYTEARELEVIHEQQIIGNQPGDPEKAATAFITAAESENRPLHLFLGSDSFNMANTKIQALQADLSQFESLSKSTDYSS